MEIWESSNNFVILEILTTSSFAIIGSSFSLINILKPLITLSHQGTPKLLPLIEADVSDYYDCSSTSLGHLVSLCFEGIKHSAKRIRYIFPCIVWWNLDHLERNTEGNVKGYAAP